MIMKSEINCKQQPQSLESSEKEYPDIYILGRDKVIFFNIIILTPKV